MTITVTPLVGANTERRTTTPEFAVGTPILAREGARDGAGSCSGRALKQRAIDWLTSAGSTGKASEELSALKAANENLQARNEQLETQLRELAAKVEALSGDKPATKSQKL